MLRGELSAARQHELATQQSLERATGAEHCRLQEAKALEAELVRCREGLARATAVSKKVGRVLGRLGGYLVPRVLLFR